MPIQWNQWLGAAAATPKAGQIRSTDDDQVTRAKRRFGANRATTATLDAERTPEDRAANQKSLSDIKSSLHGQFGDVVGEIVYQQIFADKHANGRPISSAEIRAADQLGKVVADAQKWLLDDGGYSAEASVSGLRRAFQEPLARAGGIITGESILQRIHDAQYNAGEDFALASRDALRDQVRLNFAILPADQRISFRNELRATADEASHPLPGPEGADANTVGLWSKNEPIRAERARFLASLVPSDAELNQFSSLDQKVNEYSAFLAGEVEAESNVTQAQYDLAKLRTEGTLTDLSLPKLREDAAKKRKFVTDNTAEQTKIEQDLKEQIQKHGTVVNQLARRQAIENDLEGVSSKISKGTSLVDTSKEDAELNALRAEFDQVLLKRSGLTPKTGILGNVNTIKKLEEKQEELQARISDLSQRRTAKDATYERDIVQFKELGAELAKLPSAEALKASIDTENAAQQVLQGRLRAVQEQWIDLERQATTAEEALVAALETKNSLPERIAAQEALLAQRELILRDISTNRQALLNQAPAANRPLLKLRATLEQLIKGRYDISEIPTTAELETLLNAVKLRTYYAEQHGDRVSLPVLKALALGLEDEVRQRHVDDENAGSAEIREIDERLKADNAAQNQLGIQRSNEGDTANADHVANEGFERRVLEANIAERQVRDGTFLRRSNLIEIHREAIATAGDPGEPILPPATRLARALAKARTEDKPLDAVAREALAGLPESAKVQLISLLETRRDQVRSGELSPEAYDDKSEALLDQLKFAYTKPLVLDNFRRNGPNINQLLLSYERLRKAESRGVEQVTSADGKLKNEAVRGAYTLENADGKNRGGALKLLRPVGYLTRFGNLFRGSTTLLPEDLEEADHTTADLFDGLKTLSEKQADDSYLRKKAEYTIFSIIHPDNQESVETALVESFLSQHNLLGSESQRDREAAHAAIDGANIPREIRAEIVVRGVPPKEATATDRVPVQRAGAVATARQTQAQAEPVAASPAAASTPVPATGVVVPNPATAGWTYAGTRFTPDPINALGPNEIFVFGSNSRGNHAAGAAKDAQDKFGARPGVGEGETGQSYAIPTLVDAGGAQVSKKDLADSVGRFLDHAKNHPNKTFLVTKIGTRIAQWNIADVAPLFRGAPANVILPEEFVGAIEDAS
jgi:hypothetical protein